MFHSDASYSPGPYDIISLWAEEVTPPVTPTHFASATRAWDTLPDELRARVEGMSVEQSNLVQNRGADGDRLLVAVRPEQTIITPIAIVHPRSDRLVLNVSPMTTTRILGLDHGESEALLAELFAHTADPQTVWTQEWGTHDLVVWDNLAVQHARPDVQEGGPVRTLRKATSPTFPADHLHTPSYGTMFR